MRLIRFAVICLLMAFPALAQTPAGGVPVGGFMSPNSVGNSYAVTKTRYQLGGIHTWMTNVSQLTDTTALTGLPTLRREKGMISIIDGIIYQLGSDLTTWTPVVLGPSTPIATNVAQLIASSSAYTNFTDTLVLGYSSAGDGGANTFIWDPASTAATNFGTVFAHPSLPTGRFIWDGTGVPTPKMFGGVDNAAVDSGRALTNMMAVLGYVNLGRGTYGTSNTITVGASQQLFGEELRVSRIAMLAPDATAVAIDGFKAVVKNVLIYRPTAATASETNAFGIAMGGGMRFCNIEGVQVDGFYVNFNTLTTAGIGWFQNVVQDIISFNHVFTAVRMGNASVAGTHSWFRNWYIKGANLNPSYTVTAGSHVGSEVTITISAPSGHDIEVGQLVVLSSFLPTTYNQAMVVTSVVGDTFTGDLTSVPVSDPTQLGTLSTFWSGDDKLGPVIEFQNIEFNATTINIEWNKAPQALRLYQSKGEILGLHVEGFCPTTNSAYVIGDNFRAVSVNGWEFINSFLRANTTLNVIETDALFEDSVMVGTMLDGVIRDIYIPTTSSLVQTSTGSRNHQLFWEKNRTFGTFRVNAEPVWADTMRLAPLAIRQDTNDIPIPFRFGSVDGIIQTRQPIRGAMFSSRPAAADGTITAALGSPSLGTNDITVMVTVEVPDSVTNLVPYGATATLGLWTLGPLATGIANSATNAFNLSFEQDGDLLLAYRNEAGTAISGTMTDAIGRYGGRVITFTMTRADTNVVLYADGEEVPLSGLLISSGIASTNAVNSDYFALAGRRLSTDKHIPRVYRALIVRRALTQEEVIRQIDGSGSSLNLEWDYQLPNGDFEIAGAPFASWSTSVSGTTAIASTNDVHSGTAACAIFTDGSNSSGAIFQSTITVIGQQYRLSFWAKKGSSVNAGVQVGHQTSGNAYFDIGTGLTETWQQFTLDFVAGNTRFQMSRSGGGSANATILIDDVVLYELNPWVDLRLDGPIAYDQSMHGRHGTVTGLVGWTSNPPRPYSFAADRGDANSTITYMDPEGVIYGTTLSNNRTVTLTTTGMYPGQKFRITRNAATPGNFTLTVGSLITFPRATQGWADVYFDGSAMALGAWQFQPRMGTLTLIAGTLTVSDTSITANTAIFPTRITDGGTPSDSYSFTRVANTSFTITGMTNGVANAGDTSTISYQKIDF